MKPYIISTRKSQLALWQANYVKAKLLEKNPDMLFELSAEATQGDKQQSVALADVGGKDLFVKELQKRVLNGDAAFAVHSLKDLSVKPHPELTLAAVCERADPRDVFISERYRFLAEMPEGAVVGTASPRRACQILHHLPHLKIKLLRGNVNTRLSKLKQGDYDGIILAAAGVMRLGFDKEITEVLDHRQFIPAIGQGVIGIECRGDDESALALLRKINHLPTEICIRAERAVNQVLGGDCFTPIAAFAEIENETITLSAMLGQPDGSLVLHCQRSGDINMPEALGEAVAKILLDDGAKEILSSCRHI